MYLEDVLEPEELAGGQGDPKALKHALEALEEETRQLNVVWVKLTKSEEWNEHMRLETSRRFNIPLHLVPDSPDDGPESVSEAWA